MDYSRIATAMAGQPQPQQQPQPAQQGQPQQTQAGDVSLCANPPGVPFQCGTCNYFEQGTCSNPDPKLSGRPVQPDWCCDLYDHQGMQVVVQ